MVFGYLKDLVEKPISGEWGDGEGNINVLRTTNFTNHGRINFDDLVKRNIQDKKVFDKKLLKEDIIIEKSGGSPAQPVGRVVFFNEEGTYLCNNFTSILRPLKKHVFPKYLHYILFCNHKFGFVRKFQNKTTGIINLQLPKYLKDTKIPLPTLAEQQKIAAILDAADRLRQKGQQLVERYTTLSQSLFLEMFGDPVTNPMGWVERKLKEVCKKITDGTHHSPILIESGIPYVTAKHVKNYGLDFEAKPTYVAQPDHDEIYKRCNPEFGDILYIKDGATTGIACINTFKTPISLLSSLALLKVNPEIINNYYLCFWLNHNGIKEKLIKEYMSGAAIQRYTLAKINAFTLMLPPIHLQNQFAESIKLIEAQKQQAQASLQKSEALFNSLLQQAFTGELTRAPLERAA